MPGDKAAMTVVVCLSETVSQCRLSSKVHVAEEELPRKAFWRRRYGLVCFLALLYDVYDLVIELDKVVSTER